MSTLLENTERFCRRVVEGHRNPVILCSFGKDSLVMTHLLTQRLGYALPVIFFKQPVDHHKNLFALRVASEWDLVMHTPQPHEVKAHYVNGCLETLNHYPLGQQAAIVMPMTLEPTEGSKRCFFDDFLHQPVAWGSFPWDVAFIGHKSTDNDPSLGAVPLRADYVDNTAQKGAANAFPLREWTDADVWAYIEEYNLPIPHDRYQKVDGVWGERPDRRNNQDYFDCCARCVLAANTDLVPCPKKGVFIKGRKDDVPWTKLEKPAYIGES